MASRGLVRLPTARWASRLTNDAPCFTSSVLAGRPHTLSTSTKRPGIPAARLSTRPAQQRPFTSSNAPKSPSRRRRILLILVALLLGARALNHLHTFALASDDPRQTLNKDLFTPCTVLSTTPVSPSAFLLTIQLPPNNPQNAAIIANAHHHGLWSIEVKQPQIQIARNYTPLPPVPGQNKDELRFYVRRYDGGEVSTYLSRLRAGDRIEIRGPHLGFDLVERLGRTSAEKRKVVFLAGGTGVAPAMQAAAVLLQREGEGERVDVDVDVLWANRGAEDCAGCARLSEAVGQQRGWWPFGSNSSSSSPKSPGTHEEPSAVMSQLRTLQDAYAVQGRTLNIQCAVDTEGSFFKAKDIANAVRQSGGHGTLQEKSLAQESSPACHFHSQRQLVYSTEESDAAGRDTATGKKKQDGVIEKRCTCAGDAEKGKNLFIISGPDGFVSAFAGPKVWADGGERQGPVGGVVADLMRKNPETWKDWLVLKQ